MHIILRIHFRNMLNYIYERLHDSLPGYINTYLLTIKQLLMMTPARDILATTVELAFLIQHLAEGITAYANQATLDITVIQRSEVSSVSCIIYLLFMIYLFIFWDLFTFYNLFSIIYLFPMIYLFSISHFLA